MYTLQNWKQVRKQMHVHTHVHNRDIRNTQKKETTQMLI